MAGHRQLDLVIIDFVSQIGAPEEVRRRPRTGGQPQHFHKG